MRAFVFENLPGALVGVALLLMAHLTLWDKRGMMWRLASYVIGCTCILLGMLCTASTTGDWTPIAVYAFHLVLGGAVVLLAWKVRGWQAARHQAVDDAAAIEEEARRAERTY
jgi:hypothetical protein